FLQLRLDLRPAVAQADRAVEDEPLRAAVGVDAEVPEALELHAMPGRRVGEARLDPAVLEDLERGRGQRLDRVAAVLRRILGGEEAVVEADLRRQGVLGSHPMQRSANLASVRGVAALRRRVPRAAQLDDLAGLVLDDVRARDEARVAQANLLSRR